MTSVALVRAQPRHTFTTGFGSERARISARLRSFFLPFSPFSSFFISAAVGSGGGFGTAGGCTAQAFVTFSSVVRSNVSASPGRLPTSTLPSMSRMRPRGACTRTVRAWLAAAAVW